MAKYNLYVSYECVSEHDDYEEARKDFYKAVKDCPDCPIDIMDEDCEISLLSYDEATEQVYNYQ